MKANARSMSAFTLIEIMIVVAIIGILAAVAIPGFKRSIEEARRKTCVLNLKNIEGAKIQWAAAQKRSLADTPADADLFGESLFIRDKPACPSGGNYTLNPAGDKPACSHSDHSY